MPYLKETSGSTSRDTASAASANGVFLANRSDACAVRQEGSEVGHVLGPVWEAVEAYSAAGLSCIPIRPDGSKKPAVAWKEFQSRRCTAIERSHWWANGTRNGVAIVAGRVSGSVEVLDFDDPAAFDDWAREVRQALPEIAQRLVVTQTPGPGIQCVYRCDTAVEGNQVLARAADGTVRIETRGEGGYFIAPPTGPECHPNRKPYQLRRGDLTALPTVDAAQHALLLALARAMDAAPPPPERPAYPVPSAPSGDRPGDDYNTRGDHAALLERHGWCYTSTTRGEELWRRPGKGEGHSAEWSLEKRRFCVFSSNAAPFESGRGYSLFDMRAALEFGGDFTATARALGEEGYGAARNAPERNLARSGAAPVSWEGATLETPREDDREWTDTEIMEAEMPESQFVVPGYVPEGLTILAGGQKFGKSWLALQLAVAIACGGHAMGRVEVTQGEVLFLALEDTPRRLKKRLQALLSGKRGSGRLHFRCRWPRVDAGGLQALRDWLTAHPEARLVVVDVLARLRSARGQNGDVYQQDMEFGHALKAIADDFRVALLVVHHISKTKAEDPFEAVSGSIGVTASADATLLLRRKRGEKSARLFVTGRDIETEAEMALEWDASTAGWLLVGSAEEYSQSSERKRILELLRHHGAMAPAQIALHLQKNSSTVRYLLAKMNEAGLVRHDGHFYSAQPAE